MAVKIINIGVVGCGRVAQHYKKIFDSQIISDYKFVGFCDLLKDKADFFASHYHTESFTCFEQMLRDTSPDLVFILSPSGEHYHHTKTAFDHNCHVLCEKPITMLPDEAKELEEIAFNKKLMYGVAFQNRLNPSIIALKNAVESGRFGKIITSTIRVRWCRYQDYYEDGWHGTWLHDGGVINQQAIHHVDAINWIFGPIDMVNATITRRLNKLEAEDTLVAILKFENGALGTIEATTAARPEDFEASLSVVGENGMVEIGGIALNQITTWKFINPIPEDEEVPLKFSQDVPNGYGMSHAQLINKTLEALINKKFIPPVTSKDAALTTKIIHSLYKSDETKSWVKIRDGEISQRLGKHS